MRTRGIAAFSALLVAALFASFFAAGGARAQQYSDQTYGLEYRGWGVRAGLSADPDQFFFGGHMDLGEFAPRWHFIPSLDIGFGDHFTILSLNPDVTYYFPVQDIGNLYAGAGLPIQWWNVEDHAIRGDNDFKVGLHGIAGLVLDEVPIFFDLAVEIIDTPDLKFAVGYTFKFAP